MKASEAGNVECVKVLLDRGAEVNMQDEVSDVIIPQSSQYLVNEETCTETCLVVHIYACHVI